MMNLEVKPHFNIRSSVFGIQYSKRIKKKEYRISINES